MGEGRRPADPLHRSSPRRTRARPRPVAMLCDEGFSSTRYCLIRRVVTSTSDSTTCHTQWNYGIRAPQNELVPPTALKLLRPFFLGMVDSSRGV